MNELTPPHGKRPDHGFSLKFPNRLYGRDPQVRALTDMFVEAGTGHGRVLFVRGHSGSGKTALVRALREPVLDRNGFFLEGKFNQYQQDIPLSALREALSELVRELDAASPPERDRWREAIQQALGDLGRLLTALVPELEALLGPQPEVPDISHLEAPHRFAALIRAFLGVFCRAEHPVVLFIDDWQWADAASLAVLLHLEVGSTLHYLLFVASYRDNEVGEGHPLRVAEENLNRASVPIGVLEVSDLEPAEVGALLADTLEPTVADLGGLTEFVHGRTLGNPFFVKTLLESLHAEGSLRFDVIDGTWRWIAPVGRPGEGYDDIVGLFVRKISALPESCRALLTVASCVGHRFETATLALVADRSPEECRALLEPALATEVIQALQPGTTGADDICVFQHDRVQQAAYSLIAPSKLPELQLRIGRVLLARLEPDTLDKRLMEVMDHFNAGLDLVVDDSERMALIGLNVAAGRKALNATAYLGALQFHRIAAGLLAQPKLAAHWWAQRHREAFSFYKEWAESEFLVGDRGQAERCIQAAVDHAQSPVEAADALCSLITQQTLLAHYPEAITAGRRALEALGIALPEADFEAARDAAVEVVRRLLGDRSPASVGGMPPMSDPETLMASKVLITMGPPCYRFHPRLWSVIVPKVVALTLQHGPIPQVGYSHTAFGGLLAWISDDFVTGRSFGELATQLMTEVFRSPSDRSVFHLMMGSSLRHWFAHLSKASEDYAQAWETGLQSGNLQYAAYAFGHDMYCRFFQGIPLDALIDRAHQSLEFSRTRTNQWAIDLLEGGLRVFGRLQRTGEGVPEAVPEADFLAGVYAHHNTQVACIYRVLETFARMVLGRQVEALELSDETEPLIHAVGTQGLAPWPEHRFVRLLLLAHQGDPAVTYQRSEIDRIAVQIGVWATHCPANHGHKLALARAEIARIDGRVMEALSFYQQAIESAAAGRFVQWEAFAGERAAGLARASGYDRLAYSFWQDAYLAWHRWGASAVVRRMETEWRSSLSLGPQSVPAGAPGPEVLAGRFERHLDDLRARAARPVDDGASDTLRLIGELTRATENLREEVSVRRRAEKALLASERRLRTVYEESPLGYHSLDETGCLQDVNPRWLEMLGYAREDVLGRWFGDFLDAEDAPAFRDRFRGFLSAGREMGLEYRVRKGDGAFAIVSIDGKVAYNTDGTFRQTHCVLRDVTDERRRERERLQFEAAARHQQKLEAIGTLASGAAHEINNPLAVMMNFGQLILDEDGSTATVREYAGQIVHHGERVATIVRALLAFSRQDQKTFAPARFEGLIDGVVSLVRTAFAADGIALELRVADGVPPVRCQGQQIQQVVLSLLSNARDALNERYPDGSDDKIITLDVSRFEQDGHERVRTTVEDRGSGIMPDVAARVFEPFFSTKPKHKGAGLGLSVAHGIVAEHGGRLWFESEPGKGTRFYLELKVDSTHEG